MVNCHSNDHFTDGYLSHTNASYYRMIANKPIRRLTFGAAMPSRNSLVVLVQPPFFRLLGSHNDRGPLELAYMARYLERHEVPSVVLNLDYTGAQVHCSWRNLYERSHLLAQALEGGTGLLYESAELILGHDPRCVVISAGDSLTPWVDLGNAWIASGLASMLKGFGIPVFGVGPRFRGVPSSVLEPFEATISDAPMSAAVETLLQKLGIPAQWLTPAGITAPNVTPYISADSTSSKYDVVMTSLGCVKACSFCDAASMRYQEIDIETVARDVSLRNIRHIDIGDAIFLPRPARLASLSYAIRSAVSAYPTFSCELSMDMTGEAQLERLSDFGIVEVKIGIESGDDGSIAVMNKRHSADEVIGAADRIAAAGLDLTVYVLLGGPIPDTQGAARRTLDMCEKLQANDYVINVWAYNRPSPRPTDTHFSWDLVLEYGLEDIIEDFWELQPTEKRSLGRIIEIRQPGRRASSPPSYQFD